MDLSKIENCGKDYVNAIIEIPFSSSIKYEVDKDSGAIFVDRVMYSSVVYPANYGFVPHTLADDGDPVDILVLTNYALHVGSVIKCKLIGVLIMEDEGGMDEKLLAIPLSKIDPTFRDVNSLNDLPSFLLDRIKNFFETYKFLEPDKWVKVKKYENEKVAYEILEKSIENYKNCEHSN